MPVSSAKPLNTKAKVWVHRGLHDQDDNFDVLESYFKNMQVSTVETSNPDTFIEFAACAHYFGVIMGEFSTSKERQNEDAGRDANVNASQSAFPTSSRATSPPSSIVTSGSSFDDDPEREITLNEIYKTYNALSDEEKVLKWQEAFQADIDENPPTRPLSDIYIRDTEPEPAPHEGPYRPSQSQLEEAASFFSWPDGAPENFTDVEEVYMTDEGSTSALLPSHDRSDLPSMELVDLTHSEAPGAGPIQFPPKIEQSPEERKWLYDAAIAKRDQLRATTVANYEMKKRQRAREERRAQSQRSEPPAVTSWQEPIGIVYLWSTQNLDDYPLHGGEYCMGFYVAPEFRHLQNIPRALNRTIEQAFDDDMCHRVQLIIVDNKEKLYALQIVSALGFRHEGTRRLAYFSPVYGEWRDVTYFGMLATEWGYDRYASRAETRLRTTSLFGEVLARHQQELEELFRLEEQQKRLKRTNSSETIRQPSQLSPGKRRRADEKRRVEEPPVSGPVETPSIWPSSSSSSSSSSWMGSEWDGPSNTPSLISSRQSRNRQSPTNESASNSSSDAVSASGSWLFVNDESLYN